MPSASAILAEACRLGFAAAGIAAAGPAQSIGVFDAWLASGRAAGMDYLARHREVRADPHALLPSVRSVVVVAARYPSGPNGAGGACDTETRENESRGGFSFYARGRDYHRVIRAKLEDLVAFISRAVPIRHRICVDSAPILEREWAARAGVGWIGRQGQVVNAECGGCLFLGEVLVDVELPPTPPTANQCGTCRQCVEACPTGALGEGGHVDARRCISYLTVEHRGPIPPELSGQLGESLFGCDRCTAVCPFNRQGEDRVMPELAAQPMPDAEAILAMTPAEFDLRFNATAVHRLGLERLQRNARLVLANRRA